MHMQQKALPPCTTSIRLVLALIESYTERDMNGTVVEVVNMKVEDHGDEQIEATLNDESLAKKGYGINVDYTERQCVDEELIEEVKKYSCIYDPSHMYARDSFYKETTWRQIASTLNVSTEYCKLRWKSLRDRFVKTMKEERRRRASGINKHVKPYRFAKQLAFMKDYTRERKHGVPKYRDQRQQPSTYVHDIEDEEQSTLSEAVRDEDDDDERGSVEAVEQGWATVDGYISSPSSHHTNSDNTPQHHLTNNAPHRNPKRIQYLQRPANEYVMNYLGLEEQDEPTVKRSTQAHSSFSTSDVPVALNHAPNTGEDVEQKYDEVLHFLVSLAPAMRRLPPQKQSLARIKIQSVLHELEFS